MRRDQVAKCDQEFRGSVSKRSKGGMELLVFPQETETRCCLAQCLTHVNHSVDGGVDLFSCFFAAA